MPPAGNDYLYREVMRRVFKGANFPSVREIVPEGQIDGWAVEHFEIDTKESEKTATKALFARDEWGAVPPGKYARLVHQGCDVVMSDTWMERETCAYFVDEARGRAIIGGLGLGMILPPILSLDRVTEVTVLEKHPAVRMLVEFPLRTWVDENISPVAADKLKVITADVFEYKPPKKARWDVALWDIWTDRTTDNLAEMRRLRARWAKHVHSVNQLCWFEQELKRMKRDDDEY